MSKHAVLSPSGASRWLECTPSARLEQQFPDRSGDAAAEGTVAHALAELLVKKHLGLIPYGEYAEAVAEISQSKYFDAAMERHCEDYAVFVVEQLAEAQKHTPDALIFLERKLDLTEYVPEGFGTGDCVIIADTMMIIIDLKYGKGVPVSAENNKQMMLYSLGALSDFDYIYNISDVRMVIFQPRLDSISTWETPVAELRNWSELELKPRAALAFEGKGEYQPGLHCRFCKAKAVCKANADYNLQLARYEFKDPNVLDEEAVADILHRAEQFYNWLKGVEDYALTEAVTNGKKWPGFKLVEGRSNRKYADTDKISDILKRQYAEDLIFKPQELRGITELEKVIGKKEFGTLVGEYIIKPPGKPTLAPESDKRAEFNSTEAAALDFANVEFED